MDACLKSSRAESLIEHQPQHHADLAMRDLAEKLMEIATSSVQSFIVSGINHLPRNYDARIHSPQDLRGNEEFSGLLTEFFNRKIACECRIRDCTAILFGFKNIMVRRKTDFVLSKIELFLFLSLT